jgi:diguanylate cyclase (GGDEF)-like protein/PAS domain S-box-containing protein
LLSAILEGSIDAIMTFAPVHDDNGGVVDFVWTRVNPVAIAMTGLSEYDLIGSRLLDHWTSDEMRRLVGRYAKVLTTGEAFAIEVAIPDQDGAPRWFHINCLRFHDDGVDVGDRGACIAVICRDITVHRDQADVLADIRQEHQVWRRQALHDPLTGLANRLLLDSRLEHALRRLARQTSTIAVMFIDVDGLKDVNDRYGHAVGDHLLIELATRLVDNARRYDTVARHGGDEFVVVCEDVQPTEIPRIAHRMVDACATPFDLTSRFADVPLLSVSVSVGVAIADGDNDATSLIDAADDAMYRAKQAGGNRIAFSDEGPGASLDDWHDVEASLAPAINRGELRLVFHPIVRGSDLRLVAANARVRWDHPARGRLEHAVVTSIAADTHLLAALHRWMLTAAINELERRRLDPTAEQIALVVDIADELLCSGGFPTWLEGELAEHGV